MVQKVLQTESKGTITSEPVSTDIAAEFLRPYFEKINSLCMEKHVGFIRTPKMDMLDPGMFYGFTSTTDVEPSLVVRLPILDEYDHLLFGMFLSGSIDEDDYEYRRNYMTCPSGYHWCIFGSKKSQYYAADIFLTKSKTSLPIIFVTLHADKQLSTGKRLTVNSIEELKQILDTAPEGLHRKIWS
ncbi:MAG: hypothetical protein WAX66_04155 [Patescibacteria group bacterium]